jgi:hypothetical protein
MFSLEKFYDVVYKNLLDPADVGYFYFSNFGSLAPADFSKGVPEFRRDYCVLFYDQEPIYNKDLELLQHNSDNERLAYFNKLVTDTDIIDKFVVFANSEHSDEKQQFLTANPAVNDWYYFFHGFAALDWYRNIEYHPPIRNFTKVFITFNNLFTEKRSYRLNLIARLLDKKLDGYISLPDSGNRIKQEIFSPNSLLSVDSKKLILKTLLPDTPRLIIDTDQPHGALSAEIDLGVLAQGLFHLVTETVFYDQKLHLTEKIFKPIVARRPFFLVAAPGNLAYLRSYGFRTFDCWVDESYDLETDPDQRIIKIIHEVERLCKLSPADLQTIYADMQETLDYNFEWFYGGFKKCIVNELVDNFDQCLSSAGIAHSMDVAVIKSRLAR